MKKPRLSEKRFETKLARLIERRIERAGGSAAAQRCEQAM